MTTTERSASWDNHCRVVEFYIIFALNSKGILRILQTCTITQLLYYRFNIGHEDNEMSVYWLVCIETQVCN